MNKHLSILVLLTCTSCEKEAGKLILTHWEMQKVYRSDTQITYEHPFLQEMNFDKNGHVSVDVSGGGWGGSYELRNDSLLLYHPSGFILGRKIDLISRKALNLSFANEDYILTEFYTK